MAKSCAWCGKVMRESKATCTVCEKSYHMGCIDKHKCKVVPAAETPRTENPFEPEETREQQDRRIGRMIRENADKRMSASTGGAAGQDEPEDIVKCCAKHSVSFYEDDCEICNLRASRSTPAAPDAELMADVTGLLVAYKRAGMEYNLEQFAINCYQAGRRSLSATVETPRFSQRYGRCDAPWKEHRKPHEDTTECKNWRPLASERTLDEERAEFEKWAKTALTKNAPPHFDVFKREDTLPDVYHYFWGITESAWCAWLAARGKETQ